MLSLSKEKVVLGIQLIFFSEFKSNLKIFPRKGERQTDVE
jgi:hypothetical protein